MKKWSQLPQELLFLISDRLEIRDLLRFGSVCRSWQSVLKERRRLCLSNREIPWLCFCFRRGGGGARFYSLTGDRFYSRFKYPMPKIKSIGSGYGWLVVTYKTCELSLLNPVTGREIMLPHFSTFFDSFLSVRRQRGDLSNYSVSCHDVLYREGDCTKEFAVCQFIDKAILTSPPDRDGDCMVVLMMQSSMYRLAYAKPGDKTWTVVADTLNNLDVICHRGRIYTALVNGKIASWDFNSSSELKPTMVIESTEMVDRLSSPYLVSSPSGHLLYVSRINNSSKMEIHKADFEKLHLVKITSIGDHAIVMLPNSSMCLSVTHLPYFQRDSIYFKDSCLGHILGRPKDRNGEIFIYNMKDGSIQILSIGGFRLERYHATCFAPSLT